MSFVRLLYGYGWQPCALRFLISYAILTVLFYRCGDAYSHLCCVGIQEVLAHIARGIDVHSVSTEVLNGERVFRMQGTTLRPLYVSQGVIPVGTVAESATLQAYAHLHVVLIASLLMLWPGASRLRLLVSGVCVIVLATLLDIPFVLAGSILSDVSMEGGERFDTLTFYYRFLEQGGRYLLSVALGILVVVTTSKDGRALRQRASFEPKRLTPGAGIDNR